MNFYIGKSVSDVDPTDENAEFCIELTEYLYSLRSELNASTLLSIDPYADTVLDSKTTAKLHDECSKLLCAQCITDECKIALSNLVELLLFALNKNTGVVVIGD